MTDTNTEETFYAIKSSTKYAQDMDDQQLAWHVNDILQSPSKLVVEDQLAILIEWHRRNAK